jgi:hypothetical protein
VKLFVKQIPSSSCYFVSLTLKKILWFGLVSFGLIWFGWLFVTQRPNYIVEYLLKTRTVEAEKQPLLSNGPYICCTGQRYVRCDVTQQLKRCWMRRSLWVRATIVATQL